MTLTSVWAGATQLEVQALHLVLRLSGQRASRDTFGTPISALWLMH